MTNSNITSTEFELHIAAEAGQFSPTLADGLKSLGFRDDALVGHGVVFNEELGRELSACPLTGLHMTWDTFDREAFMNQRKDLDALLGRCGDCVGYAHGEVIKPEWDIHINYRPFNPRVPCPVSPFHARLSHEPKRWDLHISIRKDRLDSGLQQVLFAELGMYYIDLRKRTGRVHRIFTIQGTNPAKEGLQVYEALSGWLQEAGGMDGSIKLEETCYWFNLGAPRIIPPVVDSVQLLN
jgi:hypothetical protein